MQRSRYKRTSTASVLVGGLVCTEIQDGSAEGDFALGC
jgi:hypothetical protein